jgi:hypothetical protein
VNVVTLQVFVSLTLVAGSIVLFIFSVRQRDFDHGDRLSLAPLEPDPTADPAEPMPAPPAQKETCTPSASNTTTP